MSQRWRGLALISAAGAARAAATPFSVLDRCSALLCVLLALPMTRASTGLLDSSHCNA